MSHHHDHDQDVADLFTQETWDARYAESERIWSGRPNPRLVEQVTGMTPGDALDVGAGEGADAVWLAGQGWRVTALDVSEVALARVDAHATEAGVGERVTTLHHDLMTGAALSGEYDLVSAQYLHPPTDRFAEVVLLLGAVVRPGGHLLFVGHHPEDLATGLRSGHGHPELLFTPDKVVAALPPSDWEVRTAEAQTREVDGPEGPVTITDTVVLAVRR
jgi:2-polyprenyl-3-methyl-5-hydroxy-6-metoxy-1,4-benzoquinol methylase